MKKSKKYVLSLGLLASTALPIAAVVSCGSSNTQDVPSNTVGNKFYIPNSVDIQQGVFPSQINSNVGWKALINLDDALKGVENAPLDVSSTQGTYNGSEQIDTLADKLFTFDGLDDTTKSDFEKRLDEHDMLFVITLMDTKSLISRSTKAIYLSQGLSKQEFIDIFTNQNFKISYENQGVLPSFISIPPANDLFSTSFDDQSATIFIIVSSTPVGGVMTDGLKQSISKYLDTDPTVQQFIQSMSKAVNVSVYFRNNYLAYLLQTELGIGSRTWIPSSFLDGETFVPENEHRRFGFGNFQYIIGKYDSSAFTNWATNNGKGRKYVQTNKQTSYNFNRQGDLKTIYNLNINLKDTSIANDLAHNDPQDPKSWVTNRFLEETQVQEIVNNLFDDADFAQRIKYISPSNLRFGVRLKSDLDKQTFKDAMHLSITEANPSNPAINKVLELMYTRFMQNTSNNGSQIKTPMTLIGINETDKNKLIDIVKTTMKKIHANNDKVENEQELIIRRLFDWTVETYFDDALEYNFDNPEATDGTVGLLPSVTDLKDLTREDVVQALLYKADGSTHNQISPITIVDTKEQLGRTIRGILDDNALWKNIADMKTLKNNVYFKSAAGNKEIRQQMSDNINTIGATEDKQVLDDIAKQIEYVQLINQFQTTQLLGKISGAGSDDFTYDLDTQTRSARVDAFEKELSFTQLVSNAASFETSSLKLLKDASRYSGTITIGTKTIQGTPVLVDLSNYNGIKDAAGKPQGETIADFTKKFDLLNELVAAARDKISITVTP